MTGEEAPYRVEPDDGGWRVLDADGNTCVACRDEQNARHYADLLCRAHRAGYKAGFRAGRGAGRR